MGLTFPQPCKWRLLDSEGEVTQCPEVPPEMPKYDWECDPRNGTCAEGKFTIKYCLDFRISCFFQLFALR